MQGGEQAAKAASILAALKPDELDQYFGVGMVSKKAGKTIDLVAAPTTSGSGSEVTKFAIITDSALRVKKIILDAAIVPAAAVVDPELTYSLSRHVTLVAGLDAMTHLMEGYLNTVDEGVDPEANQRALTGLKLLFAALPRAVEDAGDRQARELMSLAATLGGTVLYFKQAGGPHLNSFSWCNVMDHGEACAVMLPYYGAYYAPAVPEKLAVLRDLMGAADSGDLARDFAGGLLKFYERLGFPTTLKGFPDFTEDLIEKAVNDASQNAVKLQAMPRPITLDQSKGVLGTIIQGAYHGSLDQIIKL
jgi:alcohol dehydrogenase class IV